MPTKKEQQPLSITHPELAKEADGWSTDDVTAGSNKLKTWRCQFGHRWTAKIGSRTHFKLGCPVCSNQKILAGYNDLLTINPSLAKEAEDWDPQTVGAGSNRKVKWRCSKSHIWSAKISHRNRGAKCPYCTNQKVLAGFNDLATTHPHLAKEAFGWDPTQIISANLKKMDWQCPLGHAYKTSISERKLGANCSYCSGRKVLKGFNDLGTLLPQLASEAVGWDPSSITIGVDKFLLWKCDKGHEYFQKPSKRRSGSGCTYCSNSKVLAGFNDLATTHPHLAKEAFGWDPTQVLAGSNKKVEWQCNDGHIWKMMISDRKYGDGCVYCSGHQVLAGFNDLVTTHPEIAKDALGWDPSKINAGSNKKLEWKCGFGHTWKAIVANRALRNDQCVYCSNKQVLQGFNDLGTTHPELAKQALGWNVFEYTAGSGKKMKWKCSEGHTWTAVIGSRTNLGVGCPTCSKFGFDPNKKGFLYFITHQQWEMFQIGITNIPNDRLSDHKKLGWELLEIRGPMDGHLTQQWETAILRMLKAKGADLSNDKIAGKFDGYSEAWSKSTFEAKSINELMRLTEEFEEGKKTH